MTGVHSTKTAYVVYGESVVKCFMYRDFHSRDYARIKAYDFLRYLERSGS